ncbi:MAG: hypothetical protein VCE74_21945 [Alphaproteobacteria bacterium]
MIKARRHLFRQRRDTQNTIRGFLGSLGLRFAKGSGKLADRVEAVLAERTDLAAMIAPLLAGAEAVAAQIKRLRQRGRRAGKGDAGGRPADYHPRRRPI